MRAGALLRLNHRARPRTRRNLTHAPLSVISWSLRLRTTLLGRVGPVANYCSEVRRPTQDLLKAHLLILRACTRTRHAISWQTHTLPGPRRKAQIISWVVSYLPLFAARTLVVDLSLSHPQIVSSPSIFPALIQVSGAVDFQGR